MKKKIFILGMIVSLMTLSCSKKDDSANVANEKAFTNEEAEINTKLDVINDDVSNIVEEQLQLTLENSTSGKQVETEKIGGCATVTRVPAFGTIITPGTTVTKTIDFGAGCTNGNVLKGIIKISFVFNPTATSHTVTYTFIDFSHNLRKVNGTKTFTMTMSAPTATSPSHPIVTMTMDMEMILPDGRIFTRVGSRTREIIEGFITASPSDNVYKVTGEWTTTFPNKTPQTSTITSPLIIKAACTPTNYPIAQGIITFTRNSKSATLDYGIGTCDNLAVFTIDGASYTIVLGK
jgi:hypothetical protein